MELNGQLDADAFELGGGAQRAGDDLGALNRDFFAGDDATIVEVGERIVHQLHALFASGLDNAGQHEGFCFADNVSYRRRVGECFQGERAAGAVDARN